MTTNYKYQVMRGNQLLIRTLTYKRAAKIAALYAGATVVSMVLGCASAKLPVLPCDADNCGKVAR